jgi:hypothetical protein
MQGYTVLFTPGYDHAGIATQAVVETRLIKTEGHGRHHYGREKFLEKVWEWKDQCVNSFRGYRDADHQVRGKDLVATSETWWIARLGQDGIHHVRGKSLFLLTNRC